MRDARGIVMTEAEWLACADPQPMLEFLRGKASDRKLRLFAVACCRRIWHLLTDERSRNAVEVAEQFADGMILERDRETACSNSLEAATQIAKMKEKPNVQLWCDLRAARAATLTVQEDAWRAAITAPDQAARAEAIWKYGDDNDWSRILALLQNLRIPQAQLLHDIFDNPFRPVCLNPSWMAWNDGIIRTLAQKIYNDRSFDQMPLLADDLEKAGCDNQEILGHCRGLGPHVRGCGVVDLVLGKE
jgi:hypothetical protein